MYILIISFLRVVKLHTFVLTLLTGAIRLRLGTKSIAGRWFGCTEFARLLGGTFGICVEFGELPPLFVTCELLFE